MVALVGCTGFVGGNLYAKGQIDAAYHSTDIQRAYRTRPDTLIYAGLRAEKYLANRTPEQDMVLIEQAEYNIERIEPKKTVLISTIDVFRTPDGVDETSKVDTEGLQAYGYHRYLLEKWVRDYDPDALIIRLPALFGRSLRKNFIYDLIHIVPYALTPEKLRELGGVDSEIPTYYREREDGFYQVRTLSAAEETALKAKFLAAGFSALNFTDSRSVYQFYDLSRLWDDIRTALQADIRLWHPAVEPVSAGDVYRFLTGKAFVNELKGVPAHYDYRTIHDALFGGANGYIYHREEVLRRIGQFVRNSGQNAERKGDTL